jgi:small subunit ribosomal protein MRP21
MEASLARCLRTRPSSPLLSKPGIIFRSQAYGASQTPRYFSVGSAARSGPWKTRTPRKTDSSESQSSDPAAANRKPNEFDDVLNKLDLGGQSHAQSDASRPRRPLRSREFIDPYDRSRDGIDSSAAENQMGVARAQMGEERRRRTDFKLGPELGRQVIVEPERGFDLNSALRQLQVNCSTNRVRSQKTAQKFHVRRGQHKKNLRSERWRKLFKYSFVHTVQRVNRLKQQGW